MLGVALLGASLPSAPARAEAPPACFGKTATIVGTPGDDVLEGTSGPDVIVGLGGADWIKGRRGDDRICREADGAADDASEREREAFIEGGNGADHVRGGRWRDSLSGGDGDDILHGLQRGDFLGGGRGRDVLFGGNGVEWARGGGGRDRIYLGPGRDNGFGVGGDDVIFGGPGADALGAAQVGLIHVGVSYPWTPRLGEGGEDSFFGGKGDDSIALGPGRDTILGGAGSDGIVVRTKRSSSFEADLRAGRAVGAGAGTDVLESVENAAAYGVADLRVLGDDLDNHLYASSSSAQSTVTIGGRGGDDSIRIPWALPGGSSSGAGRLFGGDGDDRMWAGCGEGPDDLGGGRGDDELVACRGPDRLFGRSGDDVLRDAPDDSRDAFDGGEGNDLVSYKYVLTPVSVDLSSGQASTCGTLSPCDVSVLVDVEDAEGTTFDGDNLTGDEGDNDLYGLGGDDVLSGMGGDDRLFGDEGDDVLDGGEGANSNDGGDGIDNCQRPSSSEGATDCEVPPVAGAAGGRRSIR
jgi:Ca2+-binding RTX toxin-like protein